MTTAEELLRSITSQPNPEGHIVVGGDRFIKVPNNLKRLAVQYDHNMETVTFDCPRYWDNRDMSKMAVYINYMLSNGYTDRYPADNVREDGDVMHFDWTITRNVSQVAGSVSFLVCVMKTDADGNEERHWNSELCSECYVSQGMETEEHPALDYPDEVTQLLLRMDTVEKINVQAEEMQALYDATVEVANTAEETKNQAIDASNHIKNSYASTIKSVVSGEMIHAKDVSPIEHDVKCLVHGKNLCNLSVLPIHEPSDPAVYISDVGTDYIDVTASPTYDGNGHVQTSVRLKELCPQMRVGKQYVLSGISDAWNKCMYLRALDYFWNFGYPITVTQEMLDCTVGFYGYAPFRGQETGVCRISNIQIEEGSVVTVYEPYIDPTTANVTCCGKNALRLMGGQTAYGVTINVDANEIVTISGTSTQGVNMHVGKAIVKAGRKYKPIVELYGGKVELKYWDEAIGIQTHPDANGHISSTRDAEITVFIYAAEAGAVFNGRFKVMLVLADDELDKVYEKYSLSKAIPSSDGSCVFTSKSPTMTLFTDTPGVIIEAEYNVDTKTYIEQNSGAVSDEQIESAVEDYLEENPIETPDVDLTDYVKKTDYGSQAAAGLCRGNVALGSYVGDGGTIVVQGATNQEILAKTQTCKPIAPATLDYAVKVGLTTNTIALTDDEKAAAQNWLGLGSIETAKDAVLYTAQELTEEQKAQARQNIGVDASGTTVDGTLTQHGVAADAGSVGDMLHAELSYSVTDSVKAGSDYKGYYNGKRVDVFIPAYTDFDIIVETDAFDTSILYCYQNETTNMAFSTDFPSNTRRTYNTYYDITGITLYAKSADITQSGDFTIKVTLKNKDGIEYRLANAELGISKSDILNLNPQDEMLPLFQHARGSTEEGGNYGANRPKCLVLAHFSDIHGDGENLNRIVRFTDTYKDYIDDVVCTGDIARDNASSNGVEEDFSWWSNNGGENVLMTIGNHDTNVVVGTTSNWRDYGKVNTYNKYFAPFVDNWGVTQPSDAASGGKCYYYKDYPAYNIRVIALDCMYYDADHDAWFVDVLADARTKGYAVITMAHALGDSGENIECTYSAINTTAGPALLDSGEYIFCANVHSRIDDFIAAGGTFICFLGGHYHRDLFGLVKGTDNKQLYSLAACAGSYAPGRDFDGTIGTRSQDCFNIVAVDPTLKLVKLFKVGCQYDNYMRQKGTLCYNYETHKLVYNGGGSSSDVGDIDAALNAIIAIQNELMGGESV